MTQNPPHLGNFVTAHKIVRRLRDTTSNPRPVLDLMDQLFALGVDPAPGLEDS